jgi:hypothetical protein
MRGLRQQAPESNIHRASQPLSSLERLLHPTTKTWLRAWLRTSVGEYSQLQALSLSRS